MATTLLSYLSRLPLASYYEPLIESGYVPDVILRRGIRALLSRKIASLASPDLTSQEAYKQSFFRSIKENEQVIAVHTKEANEQHYEVPSEFFELCLGDAKKYSSCLFENGAKTLEEAELAMLELYAERAQLEDGMTMLDLGCGWGSLCLFLAQKYPKSKILALSNSNSQRAFINKKAQERGLKNLTVFTGDINTFEFPSPVSVDRILSIEMFEHMRNYSSLLKKVSSWLNDDGKLFVHVFCHKDTPYHFVTTETNSWMAKYFFTGGTMPSEDLFLWFQQYLSVESRWIVDGRNYGQTSEEWLKRLDQNKAKAMPILKEAYGSDQEAERWFQRWRIFYLAVAETFNYDNGQEWFVVHYLFNKK